MEQQWVARSLRAAARRAERCTMLDIHTHLHPPRLSAAIRRWFGERSPWRMEHPTEPHHVAAALRAAGVERFVFCSYAHRTGMARDLNAWLSVLFTENARAQPAPR